MSSSVIIMKTTEKYLYQIVSPLLIIIGSFGSIINLIMFTKKTVRKNPCSIYFIAYNLANLFYINFSLLLLTLDVAYNIDPSRYNLISCRFRIYLSIFLNWLSPFYLILASIDRILVTSSNVITRQRSTLRFAYLSVTLGTLFWMIIHSHAFIFSNIIQLTPGTYICYHQLGIYLSFMGYYTTAKEILTLLLLTIFGLWFINNLRNIRRARIAPIENVNQIIKTKSPMLLCSKDRQLVVMLLMNIISYGLFSIVFAIYLMYQQITQNNVKTFEQIQMENIVRNYCFISIAIPYCSSFYTNIIASKTFRNEVKKLLLCKRL